MIFQHSAVTEVEPWSITESTATMPADIHPAYLGNGLLALALDATGMQGLDARVMEQPEVVSMRHLPTHLSDDLSIFHAGTLSKHHRQEYDQHAPGIKIPWGEAWGLMPAGYLDYELVIDGERLTAADLLREATDWSRYWHVRDGGHDIAFNIRNCTIKWQCSLERNSAVVAWRFSVDNLISLPRTVTLKVFCKLQTRRGDNLALGDVQANRQASGMLLTWRASSDLSAAPVKAPYDFVYGLGVRSEHRMANMKYKEIPDLAVSMPLTCSWQTPVLSLSRELKLPGLNTDSDWAQERVELCILAYLGCSTTGTADVACALRELGMLAADKDLLTSTGVIVHGPRWYDLFDNTATFCVGDPQLEFVYHQQQYLLLAGCPWKLGSPANFLWNQNFMGSTFWDSFFTVDGMLRAGHVAPVREFIQWLAEVALQTRAPQFDIVTSAHTLPAAGPTQRPFYWVHYYDGQPWADDVAYQVMAAHAGSAVRYYEFTRDREALAKWVYPIVRAVADYTYENLIELRDGQWRFKVIMSGDVCGDDNPGTEETGVLAWLVTALAKAVEYAGVLGVAEPALPAWCAVVDHVRAHPFNWEKPCLWWAWLPYITGAEPFYDAAAWVAGQRAALGGGGVPHMRANDLGQPWGAFSGAASCFQLGLANAGLAYLENGLKQVYGLGNFCEFRYDKMENAGNAPLPTAAGAFLSAMGALFVHGTMWSDDVHILTALPSTWQSRRLTFERVCSPNGARVSGTSAPDRVMVEVATGAERPRRLVLGIPVRLWGVPLALTVGGQALAYEVAADGRTLSCHVAAGTHTLTLTEDQVTACPVVVYEPKARGRRFAALLRTAGAAVRLVRDPRTLERYLATAKVLLLPASQIMLPPYLLAAVEAFGARGGAVVGLHHAGCSEVNPRLAAWLGVQARTNDRFKSTYGTRTARVLAPHPLTTGLPATFPFPIADRLSTPLLAADTQVLLADDETGDAFATWRALPGGGLAIWLACGQEHAGDTLPPGASLYDAIDRGDLRADERFTYPYLDSPHGQRLLQNAVRWALAR